MDVLPVSDAPGAAGSELREGSAAPDANVPLSDGTRTTLGDLWRGGPLALVFLRHFG